jgi:hypothetical protein
VGSEGRDDLPRPVVVASFKVLRLDWSIGRLIGNAGAGESRCAALT